MDYTINLTDEQAQMVASLLNHVRFNTDITKLVGEDELLLSLVELFDVQNEFSKDVE